MHAEKAIFQHNIPPTLLPTAGSSGKQEESKLQFDEP
jgi:hypothetical protein